MIERVDWFSRKFSFDFPTWMFPNIVERLRGTPARLQDRLGPLAKDILTQREGESWSIQENAGHLLDLEALWMGRVDDFLTAQEVLRPADLSNKKTYAANHNESSIADILAAFRTARMALVQHLDACDETMVLRIARHPRLNTEMRILDLTYFAAEHDDHHLAEITALIHKFKG